jgi:hypothetical protein
MGVDCISDNSWKTAFLETNRAGPLLAGQWMENFSATIPSSGPQEPLLPDSASTRSNPAFVNTKATTQDLWLNVLGDFRISRVLAVLTCSVQVQ